MKSSFGGGGGGGGGLKVGVYSMWEFETAGVHCGVLTQPTAVLAFRPQRGRKRESEQWGGKKQGRKSNEPNMNTEVFEAQ